MNRENIDWAQVRWNNTAATQLPRILIIGDSIVVGYNPIVAELLANKANISFYSTSKCVGDPSIIRELEYAVGEYPCDMIHFNNGLHGFSASETEYANGLKTYTGHLLQLVGDTPCVWASSTPVTVKDTPEAFDPVLNPRIIERNRLADQIMRQHHIPVNDLYSLVHGHPEYSCGDGYHYNEDGKKAQAAQVAKVISDTLNLK